MNNQRKVQTEGEAVCGNLYQVYDGGTQHHRITAATATGKRKTDIVNKLKILNFSSPSPSPLPKA
jgi:hypothetical protein